MQIRYLLKKNILYGIFKIALMLVLVSSVYLKNQNAIIVADHFDYALKNQNKEMNECHIDFYQETDSNNLEFDEDGRLYGALVNAIEAQDDLHFIPYAKGEDGVVCFGLDYYNEFFHKKYKEGLLVPSGFKNESYAGFQKLGVYDKSIEDAIPTMYRAFFDPSKTLVILSNDVWKLRFMNVLPSSYEAHIEVSKDITVSELNAILDDVLEQFDEVAKNVGYKYTVIRSLEGISVEQRDANVDDYTFKARHRNRIYMITNVLVTIILIRLFIFLNKEFIFISLLQGIRKYVLLIQCTTYCLIVNVVMGLLLKQIQYRLISIKLQYPYRIPILCMIVATLIDFVVLMVYLFKINGTDQLMYIKMKEID